MSPKVILYPRLYFSYNQFMVFDQNVLLPGCAWTDEHAAQGFARRDSCVNFGTLLEYGHADVSVGHSVYQPSEVYERVIAVPFLVTSGKVIVEGPEETVPERNVLLSPGDYRLIAAQWATGDEEEMVDLFFEPLLQPLEQSSVLVSDGALNPQTPLLENAEVAGEP